MTITKRAAPDSSPALIVRVDDATRRASDANPAFTYTTMRLLVNGDTYASAISGTPAFMTTASNSVGGFPITVSGLTSANYELALLPGTLNVIVDAIGNATTTTLTANPNSTQYGDPVTLTATVAPPAVIGTVGFYDGPVFLGEGSVSAGIATLTTTLLNAGTHTITAIYNGDAKYASSTSAPVSVIVAKKQGTGGGTAFTITVQNAGRVFNTANPQFAYVVSGALVNGDSYITALPGAPAFTTSATLTSPVGTNYPITVSGLTSVNYEIAFVDGTLSIVSTGSTTALAVDNDTPHYGDTVTLTATVAPGGATGTVAFTEGSTEPAPSRAASRRSQSPRSTRDNTPSPRPTWAMPTTARAQVGL